MVATTIVILAIVISTFSVVATSFTHFWNVKFILEVLIPGAKNYVMAKRGNAVHTCIETFVSKVTSMSADFDMIFDEEYLINNL